MAQIPFRINLSAQGFPLVSELQGRTVVIPQQDETQNQHSQLTQEYGDSLSQPAVYYMHNVIPTAQGFASVGYNQIYTGSLATPEKLINVFLVRGSLRQMAYLGQSQYGKLYLLKDFTTGWALISSVGYPNPTLNVTTAFVGGVQYVYLGNIGCYILDINAFTFTLQALTGLTAVSIIGIVASNGYLIAFGGSTFYWCSSISSTDFTPSLITGAGGGVVQNLKGNIITVSAHKSGVMIYGAHNTIACIYTANIRYPFTLKEVVGSGGVSSSSLIDKDPVSGDHYAYTEAGLQLVTVTNANTVFPEITDFLGGNYFEDFNETTGVFTETTVAYSISKALVVVADRYIVLSYGIARTDLSSPLPDLFTHALIFDTVLKRLGKLKITHSAVVDFEYPYGSSSVLLASDVSRSSMAFVQGNGSIQIANLNTLETQTTSAGVLILGKFQLARQNICDLEAVCLENVVQGATFNCQDRRTLDGKNVVDTTAGYLAESTGLYRRYTFRSSGLNHSIVFTGAFNLVSVVCYFGQGGYR
jgi:hypothetical protein